MTSVHYCFFFKKISGESLLELPSGALAAPALSISKGQESGGGRGVYVALIYYFPTKAVNKVRTANLAMFIAH